MSAHGGNAEPVARALWLLAAEGCAVRALSPTWGSPNGVLGDPAGASADEGRRLLDAAVADLAQTLAGWAP